MLPPRGPCDARAILFRVAIVPVVSLCPSCAVREVDTVSGWCSVCVVQRVAANYAATDRRAINARRLSWEERTTQPDVEVVRLRQQRHRLRELVRPREPAASPDPWLIAANAIHELHAFRWNAQAQEHLEVVAEALRRLAWGPED